MTALAALGPRTRYALDAKWQDLLVDGDQTGRSRSEAAWSFALHVANRGWTWDQFYAAMTDERNALGDKYRRRKDGRRRTDVFKAIWSDWQRAQAKVDASPMITDKAGARAELAFIRTHVAHLDLSALGLKKAVHATAREVLEAIYVEAQRRGRIVLSVSVRHIVLATSVSRSTAIRRINDLVKAGLLSRAEGREQVRDAQVYRLHAPHRAECTGCGQVECTPDTTAPVRRTGGATGRASSGVSRAPQGAPIEITRQDAFLRLGRYAATVYAALGKDGLRAEEIAEQTGLARRTVFKHLKNLAELELATSTGGHWTRTSRTLAQAARDLDAVGLSEHRATVVEEERKGWDEVADKIQFNRDLARYGRKIAVKRAIENTKARLAKAAEKARERALAALEDGATVDWATGEIQAPLANVAVLDPRQHPSTRHRRPHHRRRPT